MGEWALKGDVVSRAHCHTCTGGSHHMAAKHLGAQAGRWLVRLAEPCVPEGIMSVQGEAQPESCAPGHTGRTTLSWGGAWAAPLQGCNTRCCLVCFSTRQEASSLTSTSCLPGQHLDTEGASPLLALLWINYPSEFPEPGPAGVGGCCQAGGRKSSGPAHSKRSVTIHGLCCC